MEPNNIVLFDDAYRIDLLPLTFTRPVADLRTGILTIREKWEKRLGQATSTLTETYLSDKYPCQWRDENLLINGALVPDSQVLEQIAALDWGQALKTENGRLLAVKLRNVAKGTFPIDKALQAGSTATVRSKVTLLSKLWDIFSGNDQAIRDDFALLTADRQSAPLSATNRVMGPEAAVFLEPGAKVECATLNTTKGPVYIGRSAEIMEGCHIRGPLALGESVVLKMGAKIYGATTLGPHCKVGGEVNNSVFLGYSNKAHDGFLGNSVIGEWCNLGADTNNSNLKNNYDEVKLWNYKKGSFGKTGLQFCGLIMGDHSKCGINTMFNTGTVVGVSANIFGAGFPRNFIPSFSWGGAGGFSTYRLEKAYETASRMVQRRKKTLQPIDKRILLYIFEASRKLRQF